MTLCGSARALMLFESDEAGGLLSASRKSIIMIV
jgi:hypothetical protein